MGEWREGNVIGGVYIVGDQTHRIGSSWMSGRLSSNDLVLCMRHSGDCFYTYRILEAGSYFCRSIQCSEFGSYTYPDSHLLMTFGKIDFVTLEVNGQLYHSPSAPDCVDYQDMFRSLVMKWKNQ